jgi:hypothetical protein
MEDKELLDKIISLTENVIKLKLENERLKEELKHERELNKFRAGFPHQFVTDEYVRKDAFIEKACNYLFSHMGLFVTFFDDDIVEDIERSEFIKKFRIAMEEDKL